MEKNSRVVGLDVHAETIAVAVADPSGEVWALGMIPNTPAAVHRLVKKLTQLGVACEVKKDQLRRRHHQDRLAAAVGPKIGSMQGLPDPHPAALWSTMICNSRMLGT